MWSVQRTSNPPCLTWPAESEQVLHALAVGKKTVRSALDEALTEGVETEAIAFAGLFDSEDKEIGVQAFMNRDTPVWKHR